MAIHYPPLKSPPCVIADWVEVRTLADPAGFFRLHNLKRYWDTQRETEDSDPSGQRRPEDDTDADGVGGGDDDAFLDAISDELAERCKALQDAYPFDFDRNGHGLRFSLKSELTESAYVYLFCLFLTHWGADEVMNGDWLPSITPKTRDLFQACSTLAAAGHITGCAISFGWPRPNGNPHFLEKLKEVYALFGEGEPVDAVPDGASPMVKDEEIDIIAWQPRSDNMPGTFYLLGQVASGDNWQDKSILAGIKYFHRAWFKRPPASKATPSIFVPQFVQQVGSGNRKDRIDLLTAKFGHVIDRMILPCLTQTGIQLADTPQSPYFIERRNDIPQIVDWVIQQTDGLKACGQVPL